MARRKRRQSVKAQLRSDGALCVTFVNTGSEKRQALETYADLLAWGVEAGALGAAEVPRLERRAAERPGIAAGVVRRARTLRRRLERILLALAEGARPAGDDLEALNAELSAAMPARKLVAVTSGYRWAWGEGAGDDDGRMLWPVLLSAADLLASADHRRVRRCPHDDCGLLFVARGSGRPRKWCGRACRDRASSRAHYHAKIKPRRRKQKRELRGRQRARLARVDEKWPPIKPKGSA